jgi:hypothetical protein
MSQNPNAPNPTKQFAPTLARAIVRVWPAESREWGQAFAAELPAVESAGATATWLIGGLMLLLREWLKHAWRALGRPFGATSASDTTAAFTPRYSRTPRTPLWLMLALTLSSLALLLHPEVRQALRNLRYAYSQSDWQPEGWPSVKKLRKISKSNRDPHLLALLSLLTDDDQQRLQLSEEAIEKDSSLTWLDYEQSLLPLHDFTRQQYLSKQRLDRLINWDPQNAVPHLLAVEVISEPPRKESFDAVLHGRPKPDWEHQIALNPDWLREMHTAFSAPKYDNYTAQLVELIRNVSSRFSVNDPNIAVALLVRKRLPAYDVLRAYSDMLIERGSALEKNQNPEQAIATYSEALQFAQRMSLDKEIPADEAFAHQIADKACERLLPLYTSLGRTSEASLVEFQLTSWRFKHQPKLMRYIPARYFTSQWTSLQWSGLIIQATGLSLLAILPLAAISLVSVLRRRKIPADQRRASDFWASIAADTAPWLLLASTVLLYLTYHPYAKTCAAFLRGDIGSPDIQTFMTAAIVTEELPDYVAFVRDPYSLWLGFTSLLCLILVFFLSRLLLRRTKPAA